MADVAKADRHWRGCGGEKEGERLREVGEKGG